jgi:hypothetical protein
MSQPPKNLFNSTPQTMKNEHFVNDTSSLFNNIASNTFNTPNAQSTLPVNPNQSTPNNTDGPVSAFNRLAGSKKLFQ